MALLSNKLHSLTSNNTIAELNQMLEHSHVSISWWGQRLVSIDGNEGSVKIHELASKYLDAAPFKEDTSLQDRLNGANLWERVQKLYKDSDRELAKTVFYKYLVPFIEAFCCHVWAEHPMALIREWDYGCKKKELFAFSPEKYREHWPNVEPEGKSWSVKGHKWIASKEMIELALQS